jgi:hypothetical protein
MAISCPDVALPLRPRKIFFVLYMGDNSVLLSESFTAVSNVTASHCMFTRSSARRELVFEIDIRRSGSTVILAALQCGQRSTSMRPNVETYLRLWGMHPVALKEVQGGARSAKG